MQGWPRPLSRAPWLSVTLCAALFLLVACGKQEPTSPAGVGESYGAIDQARLLAADEQPENWLTVGRDFGKTHYSPLPQIDQASVPRLGFAWEFATNTRRGLEATPIVVDGVMYTSAQEGRVFALNAATGARLWDFLPQVDGQVNRAVCCDAVNRGVAVWKGRVYVAALDGVLYSLDAKTGAVVWKQDTIIDHTRGYSSTGAPQVAGNVVVIGNAGAEFDARGYVSAYDVETGKFAWRFFIVPGDPSKPYEHPELEWAAKTWDRNSRWDVGGGGTAWDGMAYDPELNLLYVGTGNAALYSQRKRSPSGGDNLFLTSILAINPDTGRLAWHFQEVPGDQWDYTATAPMILTDLTIEGVRRKVLLHAPKNGIFYVLDRKTGEFLSGKNFVPVNWVSAIDPITGRATVNRELVDYRQSPKMIIPAGGGGHNWQPMAYSPQTGLVYIPVRQAGNYMLDLDDEHVYRPGQRNSGIVTVFPGAGMFGASELPPATQSLIDSGKLLQGQPDPKPVGFLRAWDPIAQRSVWEVPSAGGWDRAGVLATGGGLVVQGTGTGLLRVHDASSGKLLKEIDVGTSIMAAPMTYSVNGQQYIAVMAGLGGGSMSFMPPPGSAAYRNGNQGRIVAFRLDGGATPKPEPLPPVPPIPEPPALKASAAEIARGGQLFADHCSRCHGNSDGRGVSPDLRRLSAASHEHFPRILLEGLLRPLGMPQWDDLLSRADVDAIHAYIISISWKAYRDEQQGKLAAPVTDLPDHN